MEKLYYKQANQAVRAITETDDMWCGTLFEIILMDDSKINCGLPNDADFCSQNGGARTLNCYTRLYIDQ